VIKPGAAREFQFREYADLRRSVKRASAAPRRDQSLGDAAITELKISLIIIFSRVYFFIE